MSNQDIRWRQRQQNFNRTLTLLEGALAIPEPDITQRAGIIQFFEMAFELSWKMLKDYLEGQGFTDLNSPRVVLKKAFEVELITNGRDWLQILQDRNLMSHTYNEATAVTVENLIRHTYYPLLAALRQTMLERDHE
ncbi:MAG: nucleotidyltransferase substrate binding protein [Anaerolinea sp.]|nr:nucleotidyltransferase substrate binding protein [Anaerolinea sp.]